MYTREGVKREGKRSGGGRWRSSRVVIEWNVKRHAGWDPNFTAIPERWLAVYARKSSKLPWNKSPFEVSQRDSRFIACLQGFLLIRFSCRYERIKSRKHAGAAAHARLCASGKINCRGHAVDMSGNISCSWAIDFLRLSQRVKSAKVAFPQHYQDSMNLMQALCKSKRELPAHFTSSVFHAIDIDL